MAEIATPQTPLCSILLHERGKSEIKMGARDAVTSIIERPHAPDMFCATRPAKTHRLLSLAADTVMFSA